MPKKTRTYAWCKFPPDVIRQAREIYSRRYRSSVDAPDRPEGAHFIVHTSPNDVWVFENAEEFFAEYRNDVVAAAASWSAFGASWTLAVRLQGSTSEVAVGLPNRGDVEEVFNIFNERLADARIQPRSHDIHWAWQKSRMARFG